MASSISAASSELKVHFEDLSDELILDIFQRLDRRSLGRAGRVNKRFLRIFQDRTLWEPLVTQVTPPNFPISSNPFQLYKNYKQGRITFGRGLPIHCQILQEPFPINSIAISPDGTTIASGSKDKTIRVLSLEGELLRTLDGHKDHVNSVVFSSDGTLIISGSEDEDVRVWSVTTGKCMRIFEQWGPIHSVAISSDAKHIASASASGMWMWHTQMQEGDRATSTKYDHEAYVSCVAFSPKETKVASSCWEKLRIWDTENTPEENSSGWKKDPLFTMRSRSSCDSIIFSPDGTKLASAAGQEISIWEVHTGESLLILKDDFAGFDGRINSIAFSPDGNHIISGDIRYVKVWSMIKKECVLTLEGHKSCRGKVESVTISPDGTKIISGSEDQTIRIWHWSHCHP